MDRQMIAFSLYLIGSCCFADGTILTMLDRLGR